MTSQTSRRTRLTFALTAAVLVAGAAGIGWGIGLASKSRDATSGSEQRPHVSKRGGLLFQSACAKCHGPDGRGDGVSAATLRPPPRDFAARPWRFEPTKESIRRVIHTGIPGTAMPGTQGNLSEADLDALVEYVHLLANSRPTITYEPSPEEQLLTGAGFFNLQESDPPPLNVTDVSGKVTKIGDFKGRLLIVNFWGMTCVHCLNQMPALRKLEADYASRGLTVLHVCADADDPKVAQAMLDKHVPGAQGLTDETGLGLARFEAQTLPTVWLIGPDGKAIGRKSGTVDWHSADLLKLLDHWLPQRRFDR